MEQLYCAALHQPQEGDPASPTPRQRLQTCLDGMVDHITGTARELRAANEAAELAGVAGIGLFLRV